jgi:hypothetical protein
MEQPDASCLIPSMLCLHHHAQGMESSDAAIEAIWFGATSIR